METFGYTTIGTAGTTSVEVTEVGSLFTISAGAQRVVDKIVAYHNPSSNSFTTRAGIYTDAGALVTNSETGEKTGYNGAGWVEFTYAGTKPILSASTAYVFIIVSQSRSGTNVLSYDSGTTNQGHTAGITYGTLPSSVSFGHNNYQYSIYITTHIAYAIAGSVTTSLTPQSTMLRSRHPAIVGSVTTSLTPQATFGRTLHHAIFGSVTTSVTPQSTLARNRHPAIPGSVTTSLTPQSTLARNIHKAILGDATVSLTPQSTMLRTPATGGSPTIAAIITRGIGFGAVHDIVTQGFDTGGASHYEIVGSVTTSLTPQAAMARNIHPAIAGSVTTSLTPQATFAHNHHPAILGSVTTSLTPQATMLRTLAAGHYEIVGNITTSLTPQSTLARNRHPAITGNVTTSLTPQSTLNHDIHLHAGIAGDITVAFQVGSAMHRTLHREILGTVTTTLTPYSGFSYSHAVIIEEVSTRVFRAGAGAGVLRVFGTGGGPGTWSGNWDEAPGTFDDMPGTFDNPLIAVSGPTRVFASAAAGTPRVFRSFGGAPRPYTGNWDEAPGQFEDMGGTIDNPEVPA